MAKPKANEKVRLFRSRAEALKRSLVPGEIVPVETRHKGNEAHYLMRWFADNKIGVLCIDGKWRHAADTIFPKGVQ